MKTGSEIFVYLLSELRNEKMVKRLIFSRLTIKMLRRPDSNRRPLGYEPNELPTAPLRDVYSIALFLNCDAKVRLFFVFANKKLNYFDVFFKFVFILLYIR